MAGASDCADIPPVSAFTNYDLFDKVAKTVIADLRVGIPFFNNVLVQNNVFTVAQVNSTDPSKKGGVRDVYRGADTRVAVNCAIRVIPTGKTQSWLATRVRTDRFTFDIECMIKNTSEREVNDEQISVFGHAVQNYLVRFSNLQPIILDTSPQIRAYDSWAEVMDLNTAELKGTYRKATITYWIDVMNSYIPTFDQITCN